jgi:hypothetical protein
MSDDFSDTKMERLAVKIEQRSSPASRHIENALAIAGIIQALLYGTLEALRHNGIAFGKCEAPDGIPWVTVLIFMGCVAPKTLGRATAGKLWEKIPIIGGGK